MSWPAEPPPANGAGRPATGFRLAPPDRRPTAGTGMLGYGFMGKAHSNALRTLSYIDWPGAVRPELVAIAGRNEERVADAAARFGFGGYYTDWRGLVEDERVTVFDNAAADDAHVEPTLAAIAAGKHVVCGKPLARHAADALHLWEAAERAGVKHLCCYNYRFVPAVQLARDVLRDGALGEIYQARFRYAQRWASVSPDGSLVTIGCHAIDQARFLVGEVTSVSALFSDPLSRPGDGAKAEAAAPGDIVTALVRFAGGASGTIDASGYAASRRNMLAWEINCEQGTLAWDLERLNELRVSATGAARRPLTGMADVIVCEPGHPFVDLWWPPGHLLGWEHAHTNMFVHFFRCLGEGRPLGPDAATFEDGYRVALISEAMLVSATTGRRVEIEP
ncbi:MAG: Gfo/Idh/MocA family protein [Acidimicrobiales bacterium]